MDKNTISAKWLSKALHSIQSRWEKWKNNVLHSQSTNNAPIDMENLGKGLHNQEILDGLVFQI